MSSISGAPRFDLEDLLERIDVLFEQETKYYSTVNYLCNPRSVENSNSSSNDSSSSTETTMNHMWRERMCEWAYQLVDHFDFARDIVGICMNYVDRFLSMTNERINKEQFQLLTMTCLFLAIKMNQTQYNSRILSMESMIHLSRGHFTKKNIEEMELHILCKLGWHVHPTTPVVFLRYYLELLQVPDNKVYHQIVDLGRYFIELSVLDCFFLCRQSSTVGMAALLLAVEQVPLCCDDYHYDTCHLMKSLMTETRLDYEEVMLCRDRLYQLYLPNARTIMVNDDTQDEANDRTISPVSVVQSGTISAKD